MARGGGVVQEREAVAVDGALSIQPARAGLLTLRLLYELIDGRAQLVVGHRLVQKPVAARLCFLDAIWCRVAGDEHAGNVVVVLVT